MGKTTLVRELERKAGERGFTVVTGHCLDIGAEISFAPVVEGKRSVRSPSLSSNGPRRWVAGPHRAPVPDRPSVCSVHPTLDTGCDPRHALSKVIRIRTRLAHGISVRSVEESRMSQLQPAPEQTEESALHSGRLGVLGIVFFVVAAAAPLVGMTGAVPVAIVVGQRRRGPRGLRRRRHRPAPVLGRVRRDGDQGHQRGRLLRVRRPRARDHPGRRLGVRLAGRLPRGPARGLRLLRRCRHRPDGRQGRHPLEVVGLDADRLGRGDRLSPRCRSTSAPSCSES